MTYLPIGTRVRVLDSIADQVATGHIMSLPVWYRHEDDRETEMHLGYMVELDSPYRDYYGGTNTYIGALLFSLDSLELVETAKV